MTSVVSPPFFARSFVAATTVRPYLENEAPVVVGLPLPGLRVLEVVIAVHLHGQLDLEGVVDLWLDQH